MREARVCCEHCSQETPWGPPRPGLPEEGERLRVRGPGGFFQEVNRKKFTLSAYRKQWARTRVFEGIEIIPRVEEGDRGAGGAGGGRGWTGSARFSWPAPAPGHCVTEAGLWWRLGGTRDCWRTGGGELWAWLCPSGWRSRSSSYLRRGAWNLGSGNQEL